MFKVILENRIVYREKDYKCFLCHVEGIERNDDAIKEHLKHWRHNKLLKDMTKSERKKELNVIFSLSELQCKLLAKNYIAIANHRDHNYRCYMCSCYLQNFLEVSKHIQTLNHQQKYNQKYKDPLTRKVYSLKLCQSENINTTSSIAEKSVYEDKENIESLKPNSLLPRNRNPRKPKVTKMIISEFDKNLAIFCDTYVNMSIVPGDQNIYNIRQETIRLLQLSSKLVVPSSLEFICIPCNDTFADDEFSIYQHFHDLKHINNVYQLEANDVHFLKYPYQFSDMKLAKNYMQEESNNYIYCYICKIKVLNFDDTIRQHLITYEHNLKRKALEIESIELFNVSLTFSMNSWYYAYFFICEICILSFNEELEFIIHLKSKEHIQNKKKMKLKKIETKYHMCPTCMSYWCGTFDSYSKHIKSNLHQCLLTSKEFIVPQISILTKKLLKKPEQNVKYLISQFNKRNSLEEQDEKMKLMYDIKIAVQSQFPNAKTYLFGLALSYLGFLDKDCNILLDCENMYYEKISTMQREKYLLLVKYIFENQKQDWIIEDVVNNEKISIIKINNVNRNKSCNIFFDNGLAVEKSKLVQYFNIAFPVCRELILYFEKWSVLCQLTESGSITMYVISWLVIFFLQIKGILPSVHQLIKMKNQSIIIDGWECGFENEIPTAITNLSFKDLIKGFYTYYTDFDYRLNVICPYLGTVIKRSCFANLEQLPEQMKVYKNRIIKGGVEFFRLNSSLCVQDPIDHSDNITKAVTRLQLQYFMQYCAESNIILDQPTL